MAVLVVLYAMELMHVDGVKCQDPSAPAHRRDQLFGEFRPIWKYAATLSDEERATIVRAAVKLEQVTLPVPAAIAALPDMPGYGTTYSLHQAMVRDTSGTLTVLAESG